MVALNIKNPRTHELVRALAAATGQSQTSAVEDAVARRLAEVLAEGAPSGRRREIDLILRSFRDDLTVQGAERLRAAGDDLYDEAGLPR